jgi:hypothetical protein
MPKNVAVSIIFWTSDANMPRIIQADLKEIRGNKYVRTGYFGR